MGDWSRTLKLVPGVNVETLTDGISLPCNIAVPASLMRGRLALGRGGGAASLFSTSCIFLRVVVRTKKGWG